MRSPSLVSSLASSSWSHPSWSQPSLSADRQCSTSTLTSPSTFDLAGLLLSICPNSLMVSLSPTASQWTRVEITAVAVMMRISRVYKTDVRSSGIKINSTWQIFRTWNKVVEFAGVTSCSFIAPHPTYYLRSPWPRPPKILMFGPDVNLKNALIYLNNPFLNFMGLIRRKFGRVSWPMSLSFQNRLTSKWTFVNHPWLTNMSFQSLA